jgi:pimeloyl-ACP methyl ester carboxylesterase
VLLGTAVYALPVVGRAFGWLRIRAVPAEKLVPLGFRVVAGDAGRVPEDVMRRHVEMTRMQQSDPDAVAAFVQTSRSIVALMPRPDIAHRYLDAITCPVLIMHGGRDRVVPLKPTLAATRPDWDVRTFPELGHVIQLEAPEVFLSTIEDWLHSTSLL